MIGGCVFFGVDYHVFALPYLFILFTFPFPFTDTLMSFSHKSIASYLYIIATS